MKRPSVWILAFSITLFTAPAFAVFVELIQNGGLENWTGLVPDGWDMTNRDAVGGVNSSPTYVIAIETSDLRPGTTGTNALSCTRASTDYTYRYFALTNTFDPVAAGTLANYSAWQKGPSCRSYVAYSEDAGVTWIVYIDPAAYYPVPIGGVTDPVGAWANAAQNIANLDTTGRVYKIAFHSWNTGTALVDDVSLVGDNGVAPPLSIASMSPDPAIMQNGTITIAATPVGGSGTYNKVEFDIGNDGSVEGTDTSAPFEYTWNTAATQPGTGSVEVKVTVTDSALATGSTVFTYALDNRGLRQELITNGDFSSWQSGNPNLPVDWVENQPNANATYGQDTDAHDLASAPSLQVTFALFDAVNKFTLRHIGKQNTGDVWENHQVTYWGKGGSSALAYWKSADGVTWENANETAATASGPNWLFGIGLVKPTIAANVGEWTTITTVNIEGKALYDDISWKATLPSAAPPTPTPIPPTNARGWNLYE